MPSSSARALPRRSLAPLGFAWLVASHAFAQNPASEGQWSGPYSWPYIIDPPGPTYEAKELSHAALIPTGLHAGKVLLFSFHEDEGQTDRCWIFNPDAPQRLAVLQQVLDSNIFCSGMSWDASGNLLVAGGQNDQGPTPRKVYKLDPKRLGPVDGFPQGGGAPGYVLWEVTLAPWQALGEILRGRFYPTLIPLRRQGILFTNPQVPAIDAGGATMVLGGPGSFGSCLAGGSEAFEILPHRATAWHPPLLPPAVPPPSILHEPYSLHGNPAPSVFLDSYPRAVQMSNGQIYVAGDVDTLTEGIADSDHSWVLKLLDLVNNVPDWQLHRGQPDIERSYGTLVLLHMLPQHGGLDRLLHIGGSYNLHSPSWSGDPACAGDLPLWCGIVLSSVSELRKNSSLLELRTWGSMDKPLLEPRVDLNGVVLPTGQVFISGGGRKDYARPSMSQCGPPHSTLHCPDPIYYPELYDVGIGPGDSSQPPSRALAEAPKMSGYQLPAMRLYHHVAVFLRDGRVFVAGGNRPDYTGSQCSQPGVYDNTPSQYTGEIFSPPYLFRGYRPTFTAQPSNTIDLSTDQVPVSFELEIQIQPGHSIAGVTLLRPAAVTHHYDADQRFIELLYSGTVQPDGTATLTVQSPSENLAPPGFWMLFVNEAPQSNSPRFDWVPSVGEFVRFR